MSAPIGRCFRSLLKLRIGFNFQKRYGSSLFSPYYLGISAFQRRQLEVKDNIGNYKEKFITRLEEEVNKSGQKIFACDIMSLIEIAETDEHVDLLTRLIKKHGEYLKTDPLRAPSNFGPQLLRLLHVMDKVDLAYSLFFIGEHVTVAPWFRKIVCFQLMMNMLYRADRYDDVISMFPHAQEWFKLDSLNLLTLVFAALYQMNSQESLDHLLYLLNDINMKQMKISSRAYSFALMLPLNLKKPDIALDIMYLPACEKFVGLYDEKLNFKILAFTQLGRLDESVEMLENLRRVVKFEGSLIIFSETIDKLEKAIIDTGNLDMTHKFTKLKSALYRAGLVCPKTCHDYVTATVHDSRSRTSFSKSKHNYSPVGKRGSEGGHLL